LYRLYRLYAIENICVARLPNTNPPIANFKVVRDAVIWGVGIVGIMRIVWLSIPLNRHSEFQFSSAYNIASANTQMTSCFDIMENAFKMCTNPYDRCCGNYTDGTNDYKQIFDSHRDLVEENRDLVEENRDLVEENRELNLKIIELEKIIKELTTVVKSRQIMTVHIPALTKR